MKSLKRRKLLLGLGIATTSPYWLKSTTYGVLLPQTHAKISSNANLTTPDVTGKNVRYAAGLPNSLTFELCNNEGVEVTVCNLDQNITNFAQHISPKLPHTIQAGESVKFTTQSTTTTEFDCSVDYALGYFCTKPDGCEGVAVVIKIA